MKTGITFKQIIGTMDWELLKAQKEVLLNMQGLSPSRTEELTIEGIINLLDAIQDAAIEEFGVDKYTALNLSQNSGEGGPIDLLKAIDIIWKR
jgi:hypothetical protein